MKLFWGYIIFLINIFLNSPSLYSSDTSNSWKDKSIILSISNQDVDNERTIRDIESIFNKAKSQKSRVIILNINVSKIVSDSYQRKLFDIFSQSDVKTISYINTNATGVGVLLAFSSKKIYMNNNAIIGGEEQTPNSQEVNNILTDKSVLKARIRSLATTNSYSKDFSEAMVDSSIKLTIDNYVISDKGTFLTLTSHEARVLPKDNPISSGTVQSFLDILKLEKIEGHLITISPREFGRNLNVKNIKNKAFSNIIKKDKKVETNKENEKEKPFFFGKRKQYDYKDKIVVLKIGSKTLTTGKSSFEFMEKTLKRASLDKARAVVFDMDTPGGYAWYTKGLVLNALSNEFSFPIYSFVNSRAESAGAIIALGTDHIYMKPAASIGSALVVSSTGEDLSKSIKDKITQMMIETVRNVAVIKGHNPDIAEAFVTDEKEVTIGEVVIHKSGKVLNLNTIRATEIIEGKPVLAKGVANNIRDIMNQEGIEGEIIEAKAKGMEWVYMLVQRFSFILIMIGLAGAYLEVKTPGLTLPGTIGVISFLIFFFGNYMAGNLAGYELAVLFLLGIILILIDFVLLPGTIIPSILGGILILVSLTLAMIDSVDFQLALNGMDGSKNWLELLNGAMWSLVLGLIGGSICVLLFMKFLPESKIGSFLILNKSFDSSVSGNKSSNGQIDKVLLGKIGESTTDLVPSGKGLFNEKLLDIVSAGEFIKKGEKIKIIIEEGNHLVVKKYGRIS